ncbi:hypothetical protein JX580_05130 [Thiomicrospira microaerophila]|uniref:hypothetical protein n=1 Tax=Thiomicrospira microaerophila TaxID=406020 RepID=UPI00200C0BFC|nr:hypothetical protein [Thiomicrospira microaerophila]UQB43260.1 hypothetical protein JX580_05130 [Thiomicrospira microaerophila]
MKKQILVHIGDAKTGTSSIQNYLTFNRQVLLENDILYANTGLLAANGIANHKLAFCLNLARKEYHDQKQTLYTELYQEISQTKCHTIIISSEGFSSLRTLKDITSLKELLLDYNVKIFAYLRRPDLWVESWYSQIVKNHPFITKTFEEYFKNHQEPSIKTILNYSEVFGCENMIVRPFEIDKLHNKNLIDDFFNSIGFDKIGMCVDDINKSPNIYITELLRTLNEQIKINDKKRIALNEYLINNIKLDSDEAKYYFSRKERALFLEKFTKEIFEINKLFSSGDDFFDMNLAQYKEHKTEFDLNDLYFNFKSNDLISILNNTAV